MVYLTETRPRSVFWWCCTVDPAKLRVPTGRVYEALLAEGVKAEHGYP